MATSITRREFVKTAAAISGSSLVSSIAGLARADEPARGRGFEHRAYNGWITDLATEPDARADWPSMRLDEALLADYRETFAVMRRLGMNEIVVWGLYVANDWPLDLASAVASERGRRVERLIALAHEQGIRVLSGLGTYSWGFAEIIRAHPELNGGNASAMCASQPQSHVWMQRIVDFMFSRFEIDGVSMQSADQGRCKCPRCARQSDAQYHAALVSRTAQYIRSKWPKKVLGMSNWGLPFGDPRDKDSFVEMSRALDYMIDFNDSARLAGRDYRRQFIASLDCALGTTGGPVVEPQQHWARDRWLLPTCRRVHAHLSKLAADGGQAVEFYFHILANPTSELTLHVAARTLAEPGTELEGHLRTVVDELYQPRSVSVCDALAQFFLDAEDAYLRHQPQDLCGTISLEPLVSSQPGAPIYLRDRLSAVQRREYLGELKKLGRQFARLEPELRSPRRVETIHTCLKNVASDVASS